MSKIGKLLKVTDEDVTFVRNHYGKSDQDILDDLNALREWLKKQPHLPQDFDEERFERLLLRNKFRMELTKHKIDAYYTLRGIHREFFDIEAIHPKSRQTQDVYKVSFWFPMPKLYKGQRIWVWGLKNADLENFNLKDIISHALAVTDATLGYDYALGEILVCDVKGLTLGHYTKMDPNMVFKYFKLYQEAYSARIVALHYVNAPSFMDLFLKLLKAVIKPKLFERIRIHSDAESLHEYVPKDYLPEEIGGTGESYEKLQLHWAEELEVQFPKIEKYSKNISNEELRVGDAPYNELFGTDGTFKKLNLD